MFFFSVVISPHHANNINRLVFGSPFEKGSEWESDSDGSTDDFVLFDRQCEMDEAREVNGNEQGDDQGNGGNRPTENEGANIEKGQGNENDSENLE
jgi:hypothetical protein